MASNNSKAKRPGGQPNGPSLQQNNEPANRGDVEQFFNRPVWAEIVNGLTAGSRYFALSGDYPAMTRSNQLCALIAQRWLSGPEMQLQQIGTGDLPPPEQALGASA